MRGGVNINDLLHTYSHEDRQIMNNIISDNIKTSKDAKMPLL